MTIDLSNLSSFVLLCTGLPLMNQVPNFSIFICNSFFFFLLGVLALSWYPPDLNDENGEPTDNLVPTILDKAHKYYLQFLA